MRGRRRKKGKTSDVILLAMGICTAAFVIAMIVTFWVKGSIPDTLVQCFFGGGGVEALLLAGIKISKVRAGGGGESDEEVL